MQLSTVEQQHSKAQEALKERGNQLEKVQAQLKATQGSFEEETKKLKCQIAEFQECNVKKASRILTVSTRLIFLYFDGIVDVFSKLLLGVNKLQCSLCVCFRQKRRVS